MSWWMRAKEALTRSPSAAPDHESANDKTAREKAAGVLRRCVPLSIDAHETDRFATSWFVPPWTLLALRTALFAYVLAIQLLDAVRMGVLHVSFVTWVGQFWNLYWLGALAYLGTTVFLGVQTARRVPRPQSRALYAVVHYLYVTMVNLPFGLLLQMLVIQETLVRANYLAVLTDAASQASAWDRVHSVVDWSFVVVPFALGVLEIVLGRVRIYVGQLWQLLVTVWLYLVLLLVCRSAAGAGFADSVYGSSPGDSLGRDFGIAFGGSTAVSLVFFALVWGAHWAREALGRRYGAFAPVGAYSRDSYDGRSTASANAYSTAPTVSSAAMFSPGQINTRHSSLLLPSR